MLYGTTIEINKTPLVLQAKRIFAIWIYWFRMSFLCLYAENYDHETKGVCVNHGSIYCVCMCCVQRNSPKLKILKLSVLLD